MVSIKRVHDAGGWVYSTVRSSRQGST
jgi:hypothetical protein